MTLDRVPRVFRLAEGAYAVHGYPGRGVAFACTLGGDLATMLAGEDEEVLPLPVPEPEEIRTHRLVRLGARFARLIHRSRDARA